MSAGYLGSVRIATLAAATLLFSTQGSGQGSSERVDPSAKFDQGRVVLELGGILPQRGRIEPVNRILRQRLDDLLPTLMRESGLDMWLVLNREHAEDPVFSSLAPEPAYAARRTTILVFFDRGPEEGLERLTVNRYPFDELYEPVWEGGDLDEQWRGLAAVIAERDPRRIGINVSRDWPVADGLTVSLRERLEEVLEPKYVERLVSAEDLVVRWLETRSPTELEIYPHIVSLARRVLAEAFSERVITPGVTTTDDVAWFIRQRFADLDLAAWFMPYVNFQRADSECGVDDPFCGSQGVIQRGDVLHTDVGICYLRLCSDTQEMGYVLQPGESQAPAGLVEALASGNRWQDLLTAEFRLGRTGNDILAATIAASERQKIRSSTYTHPLGFFGHAPGPTIGMWDKQEPTPGRGDWKLYPSTAFAIEGNIKQAVPEWNGQLVQIKLEQSAVFDGEKVYYLAGRQTEWHVVR